MLNIIIRANGTYAFLYRPDADESVNNKEETEEKNNRQQRTIQHKTNIDVNYAR